MTVREFCVLMLVCTLWGLHFPVMRSVMGQVDPFFYAALRMSLVLMILSPFLKWHHGQMAPVLLGGLGFGALNYAFMFPALEMTTASAGAVTIELYMPFSILLSVIFLGERIGFWRMGGIALAFSGVVILGTAAPAETVGPHYVMGILLMVGAAFSEAVGAITVKKVNNISPMQLLAWFAVVGTIVLWPLSFVFEDQQLAVFAPETRWPFLAALAYSTLLVSLVAHGSYYWLLQRLPIHLVAPSGLMTTVIGVMGGVLLLGESLNPRLLFGITLTLSGIALLLWRNRQKGGPHETVTKTPIS